MNIYFIPMATKSQTNPSTNDKKKRIADDILHIEEDVGLGNISSSSFPTFLVVEAENKDPINISIFGIQKLLYSGCGEVKNAKKLRNGAVLVEVASKQQAENALNNMKSWTDGNGKHIPIKVTPHRTLNSSRGVIRSRDLRDCTETEVLDALSP